VGLSSGKLLEEFDTSHASRRFEKFFCRIEGIGVATVAK